MVSTRYPRATNEVMAAISPRSLARRIAHRLGGVAVNLLSTRRLSAFPREQLIGCQNGKGEKLERHSARRRQSSIVGGDDEEREEKREDATRNDEGNGEEDAA